MTHFPNQHPERIRWNQKYQQQGLESFPSQPAEWLTAHEQLLKEQPKGPALDLACGNGRHAIFLAKLGFSVEAVDISDVAIAWLTARVRELGLPIYPRVANLQTEVLPKERYQVIVNFNYLERRLFPAIQAALAPHGLLFFETFTRDHITVLGNAIKPEFVLNYNELLQAFSELNTLDYREAVIEDGRGKKKAVASLVAQKQLKDRG